MCFIPEERRGRMSFRNCSPKTSFWKNWKPLTEQSRHNKYENTSSRIEFTRRHYSFRCRFAARRRGCTQFYPAGYFRKDAQSFRIQRQVRGTGMVESRMSVCETALRHWYAAEVSARIYTKRGGLAEVRSQRTRTIGNTD